MWARHKQPQLKRAVIEIQTEHVRFTTRDRIQVSLTESDILQNCKIAWEDSRPKSTGDSQKLMRMKQDLSSCDVSDDPPQDGSEVSGKYTSGGEEACPSSGPPAAHQEHKISLILLQQHLKPCSRLLLWPAQGSWSVKGFLTGTARTKALGRSEEHKAGLRIKASPDWTNCMLFWEEWRTAF